MKLSRVNATLAAFLLTLVAVRACQAQNVHAGTFVLATLTDTTSTELLVPAPDTVRITETVTDTLVVWITRDSTVTVRPAIRVEVGGQVLIDLPEEVDTVVRHDTSYTIPDPLPKPGEAISFDSLLQDAYRQTRNGIDATVDVTGRRFDSDVSLANPGPGWLTVQGGLFSGRQAVSTTWDNGRHVIDWPEDCPANDPSGGRLGPLGLMCEVVWVDGILAVPVANCNAMSQGQVCRDGVTVYVAANPGAVIERSLTPKGMQITGVNTRIAGSIVEGVASPPSDPGQAAFSVSRCDGCVLDNVVAKDNNWNGIELQFVKNTMVRNGTVIRSGADGLVGHMWHNVQVDSSHFTDGSWRTAAGGLFGWSVGNKILYSRHTKLVGNTFADNQSRGLWMDYANEQFVIRGNVFSGNRGDGLWSEANHSGAIEGNTFSNNTQSGLMVTNSDSLTIRGNLSFGNGRAAFSPRHNNASGQTDGRDVPRMDWSAFLSSWAKVSISTEVKNHLHWQVEGNEFRTTGPQGLGVWFDGNIPAVDADARFDEHVATSAWRNNNYCNPDTLGFFGIFGTQSEWWAPLSRWVARSGETGATWCQ